MSKRQLTSKVLRSAKLYKREGMPYAESMKTSLQSRQSTSLTCSPNASAPFKKLMVALCALFPTPDCVLTFLKAIMVGYIAMLRTGLPREMGTV